MGRDLLAFLATGERSADAAPVPLSSVSLLPPIQRPGKIICIGFNYRDHAAEANFEVPAEPTLFPKFANSVIGPGADVTVPSATAEPDYEAELAVVIGQVAKSVAAHDALRYIAGYTCANDVSARDLQVRNLQWMRGKAIDTFLPLGPYLVTADEVPDPQALPIRLLLNGEVMQESDTKMMIWGVADLVAFISETMTLEPGDVITTGTPPGVGVARKPQRFLQDEDEMVVEIDGIGRLANKVRRCQ
jgi:2-keto-4-pentenoate hydratase/2-oxohepta-3-ene-1,7-dioic acid hydratase in catechol pathway